MSTEPTKDFNSPTGMMQQAHLAEAKSTVGSFDLPCGYIDGTGVLHRQVEVREITGHEEDMLGSRAVTAHKKISNLIAACVTRIGTITERGKIATLVEDLLVGDRVFLMFAIRRVSVGDEYPFESKCAECKYRGVFMLNLADLEIRPMSDPEKRIYDTALPSGGTARFRLLSGRDEETLSKVSSREEAVSLAMLVRLEAINGEPASIQAVKNLGMRDRNFLRDAFQDVEGGVDTSIDMLCPQCGAEFKEELDVAQAGFFFPSRVLKGSKKRSST